MAQEDYLKRQFDTMGKVLGKILAMLLGIKVLEEKSEYTVTTEILLDEFKLDLDTLIQLPDNQFICKFQEIEGFNNENLEKLGEILFLLATKHKNPARLYEKSLLIFEYLEKTERTYSLERQQRINEIKNILK